MVQSTFNDQLLVSRTDLREIIESAVKKALQEFTKSNQSKAEENYLTPAQVCYRIGCAKSTLQRWEKIGYLVPTRVGHKVRYNESQVMNLYKKGEDYGK